MGLISDDKIAPDIGPIYTQIRIVEAKFLDEEDRPLTGCPIA
jgi:hypothetical protein